MRRKVGGLGTGRGGAGLSGEAPHARLLVQPAGAGGEGHDGAQGSLVPPEQPADVASGPDTAPDGLLGAGVRGGLAAGGQR